jgi:hypothetical protein
MCYAHLEKTVLFLEQSCSWTAQIWLSLLDAIGHGPNLVLLSLALLADKRSATKLLIL